MRARGRPPAGRSRLPSQPVVDRRVGRRGDRGGRTLFMASRPAPDPHRRSGAGTPHHCGHAAGGPTRNPAAVATANASADKIAAQIAASNGMRSFRPGAVAGWSEPAEASNRRSEPIAPYVLSGRLTRRPAQGDIVIDLQAVAVDTGAVMWSGQFQSARDGDPASLDGIAMAVVNQLRASIEEIDASRSRGRAMCRTELSWSSSDGTSSCNAVRWRTCNAGGPVSARHCSEDPTSVSALTGLAASYSMVRTRARRGPRRSGPRPRGSSSWPTGWRRATPRRPSCGATCSSRRVVRIWRCPPSNVDPRRSGFTNGHLLRARALLLLGRTEEVQPEIDLALPLGIASRDWPRVSRAYALAAEAALMRGEDDRAYEFARKAVATRPSADLRTR